MRRQNLTYTCSPTSTRKVWEPLASSPFGPLSLVSILDQDIFCKPVFQFFYSTHVPHEWMLQLALCCPFDLSYLRRYIAWRSCCLESDRCLGGKEVLRNRSFTLLMTSSILTPKRQARVSQQTGQPWLGQWILRVASGGRSYVKSAEGCVYVSLFEVPIYFFYHNS